MDRDHLIATNVPDVSLAVRAYADLDVTSAVRDFDAVKVKTLSVVTQQHAIAATIVEGLNDADDPHGLWRELWLNTLTIASALSADSRPLFDSSGSERSRACSTLLVVSTPKVTGTRVLS